MIRLEGTAGIYGGEEFRNFAKTLEGEPAFPQRMFVGSDWKTTEAYTVNPGDYAELLLTGDNAALPPLVHSKFLNQFRSMDGDFWWRLLRYSMRSRLAMLGLEVAGASLENDDMLRLGIMHHGWRPVNLSENAGVGCLYSSYGATPLRGDELVHTFNSQKLVQNDGGNSNYFFVTDKGLFIPPSTQKYAYDNVAAIAFQLKPECLVMEKSQVPIDIINGNNNYREALDRLFIPAEASDNPCFYITETADTIVLPEGYNLLIDPSVTIGTYKGRHISSWLVRGGHDKTRWRVRCEILITGKEPDTRAYSGQFVYMYLLRDNNMTQETLR